MLRGGNAIRWGRKGGGDIQNNGSPSLPSTSTHSFFLGLCWGKRKSVTDSRNYACCCRPPKREGGSPRPCPSLSLSFPEAHLPPLSSPLQPTLSSPPPSWHIVARSSSLPSLLIDACFLCVKARAKVDEGGVFLLHSGPSSSSSATAVSMGEAQRGSGLSPPSPSLPTEWLVEEGGGERGERERWLERSSSFSHRTARLLSTSVERKRPERKEGVATTKPVR